MDWFERLTGFPERDYEQTRAQLRVEGQVLRSTFNDRAYGIGQFELVALSTLRERVAAVGSSSARLKVSVVTGDVRAMHAAPEFAGALFQVASQANALEMISPEVTPEQGVTRYQHDRTQGPACAMAAGAATIYRNYCVPVDDGFGQTSARQLDGFGDLGRALAAAVAQPVASLWTMRNGYALCTRDGLDRITGHLASLGPVQVDALASKLRIAVQTHVEVTDTLEPGSQFVSQAFCSALPVAYSGVPAVHWAALACLVLDAAYEATLWAAVLNAQRGASNVVLLTRLGGGAFGNDDTWVESSIRKALGKAVNSGLDVRIVSHGPPSADTLQLVRDFR